MAMPAGKDAIKVTKHIAKVEEERELQLWLSRQFRMLPKYNAWGSHPPPKVGWIGGTWWHAGESDRDIKTRVWIDEDGSIIEDDYNTNTHALS